MKDTTPFRLTAYDTASRRYTLGARWFHWVTALFIFIVIPWHRFPARPRIMPRPT